MRINRFNKGHKTKKLLSLIIILALILSFTACGGEKEESEEASTESSVSESESSTNSKPQSKPSSSTSSESEQSSSSKNENPVEPSTNSPAPVTDDQPALGVDGVESDPNYNPNPPVGDVDQNADNLPPQMENPSGN